MQHKSADSTEFVEDVPVEIGSLLECASTDSSVAAVVLSKPAYALHIQACSVSEVRELDHIKYNTNNHQDYAVDPENPLRLVKLAEKRIIPDYATKLDECSTARWVDTFRSHYRVLNLSPVHLTWMKRASVIACQRPGVSTSYQDDIEDAVQRTDAGDTFQHCDARDPSTGYFVRTEKVSLKAGVHGAGPYFGLKQILESAVTAYMGHQGVDGSTSAAKFYLFPWKVALNPSREFRAFVCKRVVTAISQQSLYNPNPILQPLSGPERREVIHTWCCTHLLPFIYKSVIPGLTHLDSFVLDIALLEPQGNTNATEGGDETSRSNSRQERPVDLINPALLQPYFIEVNPFGFQYSSGSSLFSWVEHYAVLYGLDPEFQGKVCFRYTEA